MSIIYYLYLDRANERHIRTTWIVCWFLGKLGIDLALRIFVVVPVLNRIDDVIKLTCSKLLSNGELQTWLSDQICPGRNHSGARHTSKQVPVPCFRLSSRGVALKTRMCTIPSNPTEGNITFKVQNFTNHNKNLCSSQPFRRWVSNRSIESDAILYHVPVMVQKLEQQARQNVTTWLSARHWA